MFYVWCCVRSSLFCCSPLFYGQTTFPLPTPFATMSVESFGIHSYILACLVKFCCRLVFGVALQRLLTSRFSSYSSLETDWRTYVNIATRRLPLYHGLVYWSITRLSNRSIIIKTLNGFTRSVRRIVCFHPLCVGYACNSSFSHSSDIGKYFTFQWSVSSIAFIGCIQLMLRDVWPIVEWKSWLTSATGSFETIRFYEILFVLFE